MEEDCEFKVGFWTEIRGPDDDNTFRSHFVPDTGVRANAGRTDVASPVRLLVVLTHVGLTFSLSSALGNEKLPLAGGVPPDYAQKWAIIIGIDGYSDGSLGPLLFAGNDAREFRELLVSDFGYDDEHIHYLTDVEQADYVDGAPTFDEMRDAFNSWLPDQAPQTCDSVLVFFAGHGLIDGDSGYLAAIDSEVEDLEGSCLSVEWLVERLGDEDSVPCRHKLVILDSCYSGSLFLKDDRINGSSSDEQNPVNTENARQTGEPAQRGRSHRKQDALSLDYYLDRPAFMGISAGRFTPVADGLGKDRHSVFTASLLQVLRDRANSRQAAHSFRFRELASRVESLVAGTPGVRQVPDWGRLDPGRGDFVFRQHRDVDVPWERNESRRLAAASDSVRGERLDLAMLLAATASTIADTQESRSALQRSLDDRTELSGYHRIPEGSTTCLAANSNGAFAVGFSRSDGTGDMTLIGSGGGLVLYDRKKGTRSALIAGGSVTSVAFSRTDRLAAAYRREDGGGGISLYDPRGSKVVDIPMNKGSGWPTAIAFNTNAMLAAGCRRANGESRVAVYDKQGGPLFDVPISMGTVTSVAYNSSGILAAGFRDEGEGVIGTGGVVLIKPDGERLLPKPLLINDGRVCCVTFGPDDVLAVGYSSGDGIRVGAGGGAILYDRNFKRIGQVKIAAGQGYVTKIALSNMGRLAVGYGDDGGLGFHMSTGGVSLFDLEGNHLQSSDLPKGEGWVTGVVFDQQGELAASSGHGDVNKGGGLHVFNRLMASPYVWNSFTNLRGSTKSMASDGAGTLFLAFEDRDGADHIAVYDTQGKSSRIVKFDEGEIVDVAFCNRSDRLTVAFIRKELMESGLVVYDSDGGRFRVKPLILPEGLVASVECGPDGTTVAAYNCVGGDGQVGLVVFDADGNRLFTETFRIPEGALTSVAIGPNGVIAVGYRRAVEAGEGGVFLFDAKGHPLNSEPIHVPEGAVTSVDFSSTGALVAGYSRGNQGILGLGGLVVYGADWKRRYPEPLYVNEGTVTQVAISSGDVIAAVYEKRFGKPGVVLFDAEGSRLRPTGFKVDKEPLSNPVFVKPDVLAVGVGNEVVMLDASPASWKRKAIHFAGRNLTFAEWTQYFPEEPYRRTSRTFSWPSDIPLRERTKSEASENQD